MRYLKKKTNKHLKNVFVQVAFFSWLNLNTSKQTIRKQFSLPKQWYIGALFNNKKKLKKLLFKLFGIVTFPTVPPYNTTTRDINWSRNLWYWWLKHFRLQTLSNPQQKLKNSSLLSIIHRLNQSDPTIFDHSPKKLHIITEIWNTRWTSLHKHLLRFLQNNQYHLKISSRNDGRDLTF